ncbi:quinol oxidase [Sulfurisphaera ohwakuensis]|uniref:Quinol oxidase n=2 Tax=Sulfurisphaera ohwakuensis TaxID=69656 RepID=A0A650CLB1_SULOH|nr:quinol oxidase [Sulfurisphaera ohwakuensis]
MRKMNKVAIVGIIFALFTVGWILGTGQWAYGNVVGPLFNNSKLPKLNVTYITAYNTPQGLCLIMNITDIDGPDAYPASAPLMEISNGTWHIFLNSSQIANDTVKIIQAPWNANKKDSVNWYSGFIVVLGSEGQFHLLIKGLHLSPGKYEVKLYTPAISSSRQAIAYFTISS